MSKNIFLMSQSEREEYSVKMNALWDDFVKPNLVEEDDWKGEIDGVIPVSKYESVAEAVDFFTSTPLEITSRSGDGIHMTVRSIGYRKGPAGDY